MLWIWQNTNQLSGDHSFFNEWSDPVSLQIIITILRYWVRASTGTSNTYFSQRSQYSTVCEFKYRFQFLRRVVQYTRTITVANWWRFMRDCGNPSQFVSSQLVDNQTSSCTLIWMLWHHYFRTRNIVTLLSPVYLCCLWVVDQSQTVTPLGDPLQIWCIGHVCF